MAEFDVTVYEIQGDADTATVELYVPKDVFADGTVPGALFTDTVSSPLPGLTFLVIAATGGDNQSTVEELEGDADTAHFLLTIDSTLLGASAAPGTALQGFTVAYQGGQALVIPLPEG